MQEKNALERFFSPGIRTSVVPQCSADPTPPVSLPASLPPLVYWSVPFPLAVPSSHSRPAPPA
jgi:hypothetical protein